MDALEVVSALCSVPRSVPRVDDDDDASQVASAFWDVAHGRRCHTSSSVVFEVTYRQSTVVSLTLITPFAGIRHGSTISFSLVLLLLLLRL